jgi:hypothetical protein
MSDAQESPGPIRNFMGLALIGVGVLWMAASGLCSGAFFVQMMIDDPHYREVLSIIPMILLVGGISFGLGFVFYIVGRALRRQA